MSERDELRLMCSTTSASTDLEAARAAGLAPKSTAIDRCRRLGVGGASAFERAADPARGRLREIEIAIDALDDALAAERREARVERLADGAELRIGGVAERQHAEFDAVEARRGVAHQLGIGAHGARRAARPRPRWRR